MFSKRLFFIFRFVVVSFIVFNTTSVFGNKEVVGNKIRAKTSWVNLFKHYITDSLFMTKEFFKDPKNIGAVTPCSPFVVREILKAVPNGNILEIGAGCGTISVPMVEGLIALSNENNPNFRVDIIEANEIFYNRLESRVKNLSNIHLYHQFFDGNWVPDGGENVSYDLIIATIPWTQIDAPVRKIILQKIYNMLAPDGVFVYISLIFADTKEELLKCFKGKPSLAKQGLDNYFTSESEFKLLNIPSVFVHFGNKRPIPLDQIPLDQK